MFGFPLFRKLGPNPTKTFGSDRTRIRTRIPLCNTEELKGKEISRLETKLEDCLNLKEAIIFIGPSGSADCKITLQTFLQLTAIERFFKSEAPSVNLVVLHSLSLSLRNAIF